MRKRCIIVCLFVCLFCSCVTVESQINPAKGENLFQEYQRFEDVPGVTEQEIADIAALRGKYGSFRYAINHSSEAFYNANGTIEGFANLYCEWMTSFFGIPFEAEILEWDALIEGLASGEVHFTGELTATEKRRETYLMTDAIAERVIKTFRLDGSESFSQLAINRTLNYAFLDGATSFAYVQEGAEYPFTATFVADYDQAIQLLRSGEIDAFFEDGSAEAALDDYPDIVAEIYYPLVYTSVSLSTTNKEFSPFINVMQKYLDCGGIYYLTELYNQGEQLYLKHKLFSQLTQEEVEYLNSMQEHIPIAAECDNYPISFYNANEGTWQGIIHDVLGNVSELTGLTFEIRNGHQATWPELLKLLETGEVALVSELISSKERQGLFLWPDEAYSTDSFAAISMEEQPIIKVNQIWYSTVALAKDSAYEEVFDKWFPNHQNTVRLPSMYDCYAALERGQVDFVMSSRNSMLSMTNYFEKTGFRVNILFGSVFESRFGINQNEKLLCSILSKAQRLVDTKSIADHWTHRVFDYRAKLARNQRPYLIGLAGLLMVILVLVVMLSLRRIKTGKELEKLVMQRTKELAVQTQAAQQASRAKSDFLSHMSHEIRTPLNAIIGMAQISGQVPDVPQKAKQANREIIVASNHLLGVLNDILDMAKIESGKFNLVCEPFALVPAMHEIEGIIIQRCEEKDIQLDTHIDCELEKGVLGDKLRLKQVLINLLGNAVKFTDAGGRIDFAVELICEMAEEATFRFSVQDNGIGLSELQKGQLFHAFTQADSSIAVRYGGTGLGLAISQSMVRAMGGEIYVESVLGEGSKFWFELAMKKAALPQEEETEEIPDLHGRRILLAEDVELNRIIFTELIRNTGVVVESAMDGQQALDMFSASSNGYYDLVLMDIQMPVLNGYEATQAIRSLPREDAKSVPVIAMTANAFAEDVDKALENGMDGHIAKPLDVSIVLRTLRRFLKSEK